jgi:cyclophilin family peptidyl-prolyl cis-trans isomerase
MRSVSRAFIVVMVFAALAAMQGASSAQAPAAGPIVVVETAKGIITIETYPSEAPKTVDNFLKLVKANFYNRQHFHRVEKNFVAQVGDPDSKDLAKKETWGRRGNGNPIGVAEYSKKLTHKRGAVGMAHGGDATKADSQFYITLANKKNLDGKYVLFGQVTSGMDVVDKLEVGDLVKRIYVK